MEPGLPVLADWPQTRTHVDVMAPPKWKARSFLRARGGMISNAEPSILKSLIGDAVEGKQSQFLLYMVMSRSLS